MNIFFLEGEEGLKTVAGPEAHKWVTNMLDNLETCRDGCYKYDSLISI